MDLKSFYSPLKMEEENTDLVLEKADFSWNSEGVDFRLNSLDLTVKRGQFVGIVGRVGSGKSSILQALTGDLIRMAGRVSISDTQRGLFLILNNLSLPLFHSSAF